MIMVSLIDDKIEEIRDLCRMHKVRSIALFGSAAKGGMTEKSDVDLLVHFTDELDPLDYADNYFSFLEGLERIIQRKIDLVSGKALRNPVLKEEIERSKIELYAA